MEGIFVEGRVVPGHLQRSCESPVEKYSFRVRCQIHLFRHQLSSWQRKMGMNMEEEDLNTWKD